MHGECEILKQMKMLFLETKLWKRRVLTVCHIVCSSWTSFCPVSAKPNARKRWNRGSDRARSFHMDNRASSRTELPSMCICRRYGKIARHPNPSHVNAQYRWMRGLSSDMESMARHGALQLNSMLKSSLVCENTIWRLHATRQDRFLTTAVFVYGCTEGQLARQLTIEQAQNGTCHSGDCLWDMLMVSKSCDLQNL